jgi:23S rRNA (adenine2503-C2)-methyltransferase
MKILTKYTVPTGNICVAQGEKGKLEFLSLGDYGADVNLNQHKPVKHQKLLPLTKKWVITISTQYGCSMGCKFCDVPKVGSGRNASLNDMFDQVYFAKDLHPEITSTERLNIHFARMGEPTWNPAVIECAELLHDNIVFKTHPVVSTMMPRHNDWLEIFIREWMIVKNEIYEGNAGLQLSINSTDDYERDIMFNNNAHDLKTISCIMDSVPRPVGRKITLNFAIADYTIEPDVLLEYFSPEFYICKLTPMHKTTSALDNDIKTKNDYTTHYPYIETEEKLKKAGYETLVFIASEEEDLGRITCGNAILAGTKPLIPYTVEHYE